MRCRGGALVAAAGIAIAPAAAQLPAGPVLPRVAPPAPSNAPHRIVIPNRPDPVPVVLHVASRGDDDGDGSPAHPFATLLRAQAAVRRLNRDHDVTVRIAAGAYRLAAPLRFTADDGGQNGFTVRWEGEAGAYPTVSGGVPVTGWARADRDRDIWVAAIPHGSDPLQLSVAGRLASRAAIEIPRAAVTFTPVGLTITDPAWRGLAQLPDQRRIAVEGMSWFTHRHAMVERIEGDRIVMQQPGWRNNLVGYDTLARPVSAEVARLFLVNALAFLREPGQFYADPAAGRLYYKPRAGEVMAQTNVVMPRLESLLSIAGSHDRPVVDLQFRGLRFSDTSWLQPASAEGYASQQSGSYLAGDWPGYPADPIRDCSWGCRPFEAMRNRFRQQPAAVQVAAARRIVFDDDRFAQLGQVALGIGNNPDANSAGIGLGASAIEVTRSAFTDLAGGAIMVGGVQPDAHHPQRPEMV